MTPYLIDRYQNYSDAINATNNPLAGFKNASYNQHRLPRGSHPLDALTITRTPAGGPPTDNNPVSQNIGETWEIDVSATFTEPLFLSRFLFHSKYNEAGLLGINTMNFGFNVDAQMKRSAQSSRCIYQSKNIIELLDLSTNKPSSCVKYCSLYRLSKIYYSTEHQCHQCRKFFRHCNK